MNAVRSIILSCEHAGNRVPSRYRSLFAASPGVLKSHRAVDIGIRPVAAHMAKLLDCPLCLYPWTRLLIDTNRTRRRSLFSAYSRGLPQADREHVLETYYLPYRQALERAVGRYAEAGRAVHLSLHSFTTIFEGCVRNADIGLLYDPARTEEADFAKRLGPLLAERTGLRIRRNYPYAGRADGMTSWLRRRFPQTRYLGIEIEFNQALLAERRPKTLAEAVAAAVCQSCADMGINSTQPRA